jgi:hypothetical protein
MRLPIYFLVLDAISLAFLVQAGLTAASRLEGDTYTASFTNFPSDVGVTIDPVSMEEHDHGTPVQITFDGIAETVGGMMVNERVVTWAGVPGGIPAVQAAGDENGTTEFDLFDWELPGEIIEFSLQTVDKGWISDDDSTHGFQTFEELDWRSSQPNSEPEFFETGFYFWYSKDGQPISGYETMLPEIGLLVGAHPFDPSIPEVVYIAYSSGQVQEVTEPYAGGTDFTFGTTQLEDEASYALLAEVMGVDALGAAANGFHLGILVNPPAASAVVGDIDGNGAIEVNDIDQLSLAVRQGLTGQPYDVNNSGTVDQTDRQVWVEQIAKTYFGDANFDKEFNSGDFVAVFQAGQYEDAIAGNSTWATGDWNGDAEFDSGDFVLAFQSGGYEKGPRPAANAVPEPSGLAWAAIFVTAMISQRWRQSGSSGPKDDRNADSTA